MKTLKFMLAAATAIGLASATQAAQNTGASTGFEKLAQDTAVITGVTDNDANSYFYYDGATAEDNESKIVAAPDLTGAQRPLWVSRFTGADSTSRANVLQVSTGRDPLLRTFAPLSGSVPAAATAFTDDTYVDTLVQFTVTPHSDPVTPGSSDKLMIYLKEMTNSVGITGTNLVVVGGYSADGMYVDPHEYVVRNSGLEVNPGTWYRLTVKCIANLGKLDGFAYPAFCVYIDGTLCDFGEYALAEDPDADPEQGATGFVAPFNNDESYGTVNSADLDLLYGGKVVFSLLCNGSDAATLQAVGFAGEGYVDDLVVTTTNPFDLNIVDFTFARTEGVDPVSFTINGGTPQTLDQTYEVSIGDTIEVTASAATGYELIAPTFSGLTADQDNTYASATYTVTGTASLTINAQVAAAPSDWTDDPITPGTSAATQYPALENTALATADAAKLTTWAKANNVEFSDVTTDADDYVEAYLLDCAVDDVDEEKDDFTLTITFDSEGNPVIQSPVDRNEKTYNGTVTIKGSTTVNGTYTSPAPSGAKFFKAELSL